MLYYHIQYVCVIAHIVCVQYYIRTVYCMQILYCICMYRYRSCKYSYMSVFSLQPQKRLSGGASEDSSSEKRSHLVTPPLSGSSGYDSGGSADSNSGLPRQ